MEDTNTSKENEYLYLKASLSVAFRGLISLPFEHPFDSLKTKMQARGTDIGMLTLARQLYQKKGILGGFYEGFVPNALRASIKHLYRWPMVISFPHFFERVSPKSLSDRYPSSHKILTGLTIAGVESFIVCPLERIKVFLMTREREINARQFFVENKGRLVGTLFQGLKPQFIRQLVSWTSFLYLDLKGKEIARKVQKLEPAEDLDSLTLALVSLGVGVGNTLITMPVDMLKTQYQKCGNNSFAQMSLSDAVKKILKEQGLKAFYFGWKPRMIQYVIQAQFIVPMLDKFEVRIFKQSHSI